MGKTLLLKRKLTMLLLVFAGIVTAWADNASGNVLLDADFSTEAGTAGWTTVDKSTKTGTTWVWWQQSFNVGNAYVNAVRIARDWDALDNDYYISTAVELKAGTTYTITTQTGKNNGGILKLEVGTSLTDMSTYKEVKTLSPISTYNPVTDEESTFTPEADGTYYFAYHAIQETAGSDYLYLFGMKVTAPGEGGGSTEPDQPETPQKKALLDTDFTTMTEAPADWTIVDNNKDNTTFSFYKSAIWDQESFKYYPAMQYTQSRWSESVDDYLISPALELKKGVKYTVTTAAMYNYNAGNVTLELGTSTTDMSTFSVKNNVELSSTYANREKSFELTVDNDGTYYLAYHVYQTDGGVMRTTWISGLKVEAPEDGGSTNPEPDQPETPVKTTVLDADFSTQPTDWTILDKSSKTTNSWNWNGYAYYDNATYNYVPGFRILQSTYDSPQDDWLISPSVTLKKGVKYTATTASTKEKESATLTLEIGQSTTDVTGYKSIATLTPATTYTDDRFQTFEFTVEEDGEYNLAYHVYEDPSLTSSNRNQKSYVFGLKIEGEESSAPGPDQPDTPDPDQPETVIDADFSTQPTDWTVVDKSSSNSWNWNGYAFYDNATYKYVPGYRLLQSQYAGAANNDWLISPSVSLKKGYKYTATTASAKEKESATLTLEIGQSTTDITGYKSIATLTPATTYTDDRFQTFEFTVDEDGVYNLAYHVYEDPAMDSESRTQKTYVFGLKVVGEKSAAPEPEVVAPADVTDLAAEVNFDEKKVYITWTNPTKDAEGNDLTVKVGAKIYNGETHYDTINELSDETTTYVCSPEPFEGEITYTVKAFIGDKESEGQSVIVNLTKPAVTPADVDDLMAEYDEKETKVTLSWTNPTKDADGNELTDKVGAKVYEGEDLLETIDELTGETTTREYAPAEPLYAKHVYTVKTFIGEKETEGKSVAVTITEPEPPVEAKTLPYSADLTDAEAAKEFKTIDANGDDVTWGATEGISGVTYNSDNAKVAANDWIITPAMKFEADKDYSIAAKFSRQGAFDPDKMEIYVGDEAKADGMTLIASYEISDEAGLENAIRYISTAAADKFIGFHIATPNAENGQISLLSVEVKEIEKATPMPVENLEGAVNSDDKTVTLTWTNPTKDTDGYAFAEKVGAKIYANGELVKTIDELTGETGSYVDSPATFSGKSVYSVYTFIGENNSEEKTVEVNLDDKTGKEVLVKNFSTEFDQNAWTIISGGNSGAWRFDYQDVFDFNYKRGGAVEDDWLISPAVALSAKDRFVVKYQLKTTRDYDASVEVTVGSGNTVAAQTQVLATHNNLKQNGFAEFETPQFNVPADDYYNIAFHVTEANYYLDVRGVAIYSIGEPTTPDVDVSGINAVKIGTIAYNRANGALIVPEGSKVTVYSANGAMAIDTMADGEALNLNSLAKGMYILKVTDAEGHSVSQKIVK